MTPIPNKNLGDFKSCEFDPGSSRKFWMGGVGVSD